MKKAVGGSPPPVGGGGPVTPAPGGGGGSGPGGGGPGGSGPAGNRAGEGIGSSHGISRHCPGEGNLGGGGAAGGGGGGILSSSSPDGAGGQPSGEGVLGVATGAESGGPVGAFVDAAARAGPIVLAVFAFGALLLLLGLAGGARALHGRLRSS